MWINENRFKFKYLYGVAQIDKYCNDSKMEIDFPGQIPPSFCYKDNQSILIETLSL